MMAHIAALCLSIGLSWPRFLPKDQRDLISRARRFRACFWRIFGENGAHPVSHHLCASREGIASPNSRRLRIRSDVSARPERTASLLGKSPSMVINGAVLELLVDVGFPLAVEGHSRLNIDNPLSLHPRFPPL